MQEEIGVSYMANAMKSSAAINHEKMGYVTDIKETDWQKCECSEEKKLKNTFGWARIDVLVMLSGCVFLASLCFSLVVEALQTLVHIKYRDEMHHPIPVMCVGASGLLLNGLCYLLIGGYTSHQGSFLHVTASGDLVLDGTVTKGQQNQTDETRNPATEPQVSQRQGIREMCRDISGCLVVIVCSLIVYFTDEKIAKFVDPVLSIISAVLLLILSYPYMKESGSILLQTIPDTINIDSLRSELLTAFPDIINVHDLHVWRLTGTKVFSTAHIIFLDSRDYVRITKDVTEFFHDQGVTQVTIQPEFFKMDHTSNLMELPNVHENCCLVQCREVDCHSRHCCSHNNQELTNITVGNDNNHSGHSQHYLKNQKKHIAVRVKEFVVPRKSSVQPDPALSCKINMSFETTSSEGNSKIYTCEESVKDMCSVNSNLGKCIEENYVQENDKQLTYLNTEQFATKDSSNLNTQQEMVMNDMHKTTEQTEITSSECETELSLSDTQNNADKNTEISTLSHSNMKQKMTDQTHVQIPTAHSALGAANSKISVSIPHEPELPVTVPNDCILTEHDPVLLGTALHKSSEKSDMVS
ncbi:hypothetical protein Cfor_02698 [Coptotermes formosanus]|uniref:Cation efflux protein cytoplasmic domain-containing protein n=1 Tax=Coptotermes formosanus TaxID=36987 RepID=A0A6L2PI96_COPFO|nr:hypothetical protein Cfor_02698 [Coptotermes formosanus]